MNNVIHHAQSLLCPSVEQQLIAILILIGYHCGIQNNISLMDLDLKTIVLSLIISDSIHDFCDSTTYSFRKKVHQVKP